MAKEKTTAQKVTRLDHLAGKAGHNIFERIKLASEVLEDRDYIASEYDGNYGALYDKVAGYFPDLCGVLGTTLDGLRSLYREYPDEQQWAGEQYNIAHMLAKHNEEARSIDSSRRTLLKKSSHNGRKHHQRRAELPFVTKLRGKLVQAKSDLQVEQESVAAKSKTIESLSAQKDNATKKAESFEEANDRLTGENKSLRTDNTRLQQELNQVVVERDRLQLIVLGITEAVGASG